MPRISRENINSRYIDVISQGINKEYIFLEKIHKNEYIKVLKETIKNYANTKVIAYYIMDNHVHLLFYCENVKDLSKIMSIVNTTYAIFYNKNKNRVGYVFRNRYYTQQISDENHLFNVFAYIHKNPVKAGMVKKESDYKFSSYNSYLNKNVDENISKLIFNERDYLQAFKEVHNRNFDENDVIDIKEDMKNLNEKMIEYISKFCDEYDCSIENIKRNNYLIVILAKDLKNKFNVTNKMFAEYIGIGKNRISILNSKK